MWVGVSQVDISAALGRSGPGPSHDTSPSSPLNSSVDWHIHLGLFGTDAGAGTGVIVDTYSFQDPVCARARRRWRQGPLTWSGCGILPARS